MQWRLVGGGMGGANSARSAETLNAGGSLMGDVPSDVGKF